MIEGYLGQLDRALRRQHISARRRRRFLAEAEDHLRSNPDSASTFGDPEHLARRVATVEQPRRVRRWSIALVGTVLVFALPLYAVPENTLPPAPPQGLPASIEWKLDWALALYGAALVFALLSVAFSWIRPEFARWPAWLSVGTLAGCAALAVTAAAEWPVGGSTALVSVAPLGVALLCLAALVSTRQTSVS